MIKLYHISNVLAELEDCFRRIFKTYLLLNTNIQRACMSYHSHHIIDRYLDDNVEETVVLTDRFIYIFIPDTTFPCKKIHGLIGKILKIRKDIWILEFLLSYDQIL